MEKKNRRDTFFAIVIIVVLFAIGQFGGITGYATQTVKCEFKWPQKVIIDGTSHSCNYDRPWCNNEKAQQGIAECCEDHSPYIDCISMGTAQTSTQTGCEDSDGGKDYSKRGDISTNNVWKGADYCHNGDESNVMTETATGSGYLKEFYCQGDTYIWDNIKVKSDEKCERGKIVKVEIEQPVEEQPAEPEPACTDSDGGKDSSEKGTIEINGQFKEADYCIRYVSGEWNVLVAETGIGTGALKEFYCQGDTYTWDRIQVGPDENCKNGEIIEVEPEPVCTDSDGGKDYSTRGEVKINGQFKEADYCIRYVGGGYSVIVSETGLGTGALKEFYCSGDSYRVDARDVGPDENCKNGEIIKSCDDSDGGKNYAVKGKIKIEGNEVAHDYCMENGREVYETQVGGWLKEYYCEGEKEEFTVVRNPSKKCIDGKIA